MICNVNAELAFFRGKTFQGAYGRTHVTRSRAKTPEQRAQEPRSLGFLCENRRPPRMYQGSEWLRNSLTVKLEAAIERITGRFSPATFSIHCCPDRCPE
jgi:hypothetical protein